MYNPGSCTSKAESIKKLLIRLKIIIKVSRHPSRTSVGHSKSTIYRFMKQSVNIYYTPVGANGDCANEPGEAKGIIVYYFKS